VTVVSGAVGLVVALLCGSAARRVAVAKGRDTGAWRVAGFFFGVFGLLAAMVAKPKDGGARFAWWSQPSSARMSSARMWAAVGVATSLLWIGVVVALAVHAAVTQERHLDGTALATDLEYRVAQALHQETGDIIDLHITCPPAPPMRKGYIFDCDVTGWPKDQATHIRVTEDDGEGHITYQPF
jgi:hypothetical protein